MSTARGKETPNWLGYEHLALLTSQANVESGKPPSPTHF